MTDPYGINGLGDWIDCIIDLLDLSELCDLIDPSDLRDPSDFRDPSDPSDPSDPFDPFDPFDPSDPSDPSDLNYIDDWADRMIDLNDPQNLVIELFWLSQNWSLWPY